MHLRTAFVALLVLGLAGVQVAVVGAEGSPNGDGTTQVDLKLRDGKTQSVSIALGQSGLDVYRLCRSAKIYADDDPWLIALAADGGMYVFLFLAEGTTQEIQGRFDPRRNKLYAVIHYPTASRDNGKWLISRKMDSRICGGFVTLKVALGAEKARAATVTLGMTTDDVNRLFGPARDHANADDLILLDANHNDGRYLLLFSPQIANGTEAKKVKLLSEVIYWQGGKAEPIYLLPGQKRDKPVAKKYKALLKSGEPNERAATDTP